MLLSPREAELLTLLSNGMKAKEAAKKIGISWHTAEDYVKRARYKLNATTTAHAVAIAVRKGAI